MISAYVGLQAQGRSEPKNLIRSDTVDLEHGKDNMVMNIDLTEGF